MRPGPFFFSLALCAAALSAQGQDSAEIRGDELAMNTTDLGYAGPQIEIVATPEQDAVRVRTPESAYFMELIDASGSVFRSGTVRGDERFDLIGLPAGTYIIQLRTFDGPMERAIEIR